MSRNPLTSMQGRAEGRIVPHHVRVTCICARRCLRQSQIAQVGLLLMAWWLLTLVLQATHAPFPAGILGLAITLLLLACGAISPASLRKGAGWYLAEVMLFFVPAIVSVLKHPEFAGWLGLKILAVIILSTVAVMAATAVTVEVVFARQSRGRGSC